MKRFVVVTVALLTAQLSHAQNCNSSQYKGDYIALANGEFLAGLPAPFLGPTTRIGIANSDGKGNAHIRAITSLNGFVLEEEYGGTYEVHPDCTTDVILNIPFPPDLIIPFHFKGVISDNFKQHDMQLINPPGSTVIISLRLQSKHSCTINDLKGSWEVKTRGVVGLPGPGIPVTRLGLVVFDGAGSFDAQTNTSVAGFIAPDNFSGTYTVDSSCEFRMNFAAGTWAGVLMDNSAGAQIMQTAPIGAVVSGTLTKQ